MVLWHARLIYAVDIHAPPSFPSPQFALTSTCFQVVMVEERVKTRRTSKVTRALDDAVLRDDSTTTGGAARGRTASTTQVRHAH